MTVPALVNPREIPLYPYLQRLQVGAESNVYGQTLGYCINRVNVAVKGR